MDLLKSILTPETISELISWLLPMIIIGFAGYTFYQILSLFQRKKYVLRMHIRDSPKESLLESLIYLPRSKEEEIRKKLLEVDIHITPKQYLLRFILIGIVVLLISLIVGIVTGRYLVFFVGLVFLVISILQPFRALDSMVNEKKLKLRLELPEYMEAFALMLQQLPLYETTRKSIDFAGPTLKPYIERLLVDIELNPGSDQPYLRLAEELNIPEMKQFMVSITQAMNVDQERAQQIIVEELNAIEELRENSYTELIDKKGFNMDLKNFGATMPALLFSFIFVLYTAWLMYSQI
jgi:Flp pilus assembly protein TadB